MSKIAFLGLGNMGTPMALRLLNAGHDVTVWNRTVERTAPLVDAGASVAASPAEAAVGVEFAITMLATPYALGEVLFGLNGLASALSAGQTLIDMSTVGPDAFRSAAARLPSGVAAVDAPVRGSIAEATDGRLHVYVGAKDDQFERVRPVLEVFGDVHHVGTGGAGAAMKLVVNTTLAASIVVLGEALALGRALGLDQASMLDVLAESPVGPPSGPSEPMWRPGTTRRASSCLWRPRTCDSPSLPLTTRASTSRPRIRCADGWMRPRTRARPTWTSRRS